MRTTEEIDQELWSNYRNTPRCLCIPYPGGNSGCPDHDPALAGTHPGDKTMDDARRQLGGPPLLVARTTPPELFSKDPAVRDAFLSKHTAP